MNPTRAARSSDASFHVVGIGEVLWDLLPAGKQLGGAPANFACHAQALGACASLVTRVGRDPLGQALVDRLRGMGLSDETVQVDSLAPTSTVSVALTEHGVPQFTIHENVAWDCLEATPPALAMVRGAQAVCFGTLAQRSPRAREAVRALVDGASADALRIFDLNLRQSFFSREVIEASLQTANILKLNEAELPVLARMLGLAGNEADQMLRLAERYKLRLVAYTRGEQGSRLLSEGRWSDHPGFPTKVVDTVGAGDAFTAAITLGLLKGWGLERINDQANRLAAHVCSCPGATPPLPAHWLLDRAE